MAEKNTESSNRVSLSDFNEVKACETLFPVILRHPSGNPVMKEKNGNPDSENPDDFLKVYIIGSESKEVADFDKRLTKKVINDVWLKKQKGDKNYDRPDIDEAQQNKLDRLKVIVKSWDLADPCTSENIALFFGGNPSFQKQVEDASADLRNFLPNR